MSRNLAPDQDDANIDLGRFIQENTYQRDKKEISLGNIKLDILRKENGQIVVGEVKKTSKYEKSATMQLAFYLYELKRAGVEATGELMFPKEKKKVKVELDDRLIPEIEKGQKEILQLMYKESPPEPRKINFCRNCAYAEFCWS
ncbi:MAG: CRISPR-associated protein Cas4 [Peptococcaceae bacterium]